MNKIRETCPRMRAFYSDLEDGRLLSEILKMEIRAATIAYNKKKAKVTTTRELEIARQLEILDRNICDNFNSPDIDRILKEYEDLKTELQSIYEEKERAASVVGSKKVNVQQSIFSILRKETTTGRPSLNCE